MRKRLDWSWLGFLKVIPLCLAIASGSLTIPRDAMFLSGIKLEPRAALWAWVRVCFVISSAVVWFQQHKRLRDLEHKLEPKIQIRKLRFRTWDRPGETGNEYWIEVFNPSMAISLELVQAEIISIKPDLYGYLPLPLHVKHDETYKRREFSVNPGSIGMVDIITGPASPRSAQQGLIIPHTIGGGWSTMPPQEYIFTLRVSARDVPPAEATYRAWVGKDDGALKCVQL